MSVINTVLNSALERSRRKLIMASIKSNALIAWAMANKRVDVEDGGYNITNPLVTGRNPNVTSYEYYNTLPVAQTDEFDRVEYNWSRVAGTVIISEQEEDENKGEAMVFKLIKAKMMVLEESIQEKFSSYAYGLGAGTDPNGLGNTIPDDPTTGSLGGLSRAAETQWRTSAYLFGGTIDSTNIEEAFDDVLMDLTVKSESPDVIFAGRDVVRTYRAAVRDKLQISLSELRGGSKNMVDLGFSGIAHNNKPIIYDEDCPVDKAYFINGKYHRYHLLKGVNMRQKSLTSPWDMDAMGKRITWQGQLCVWKAFRTHGVFQL